MPSRHPELFVAICFPCCYGRCGWCYRRPKHSADDNNNNEAEEEPVANDDNNKDKGEEVIKISLWIHVLVWFFWILVGIAFLLLIVAISIAARNSSPHEIVVPAVGTDNTNKTKFNGSVIVIGAGTAGLFTAYTLEYMGITNYTILEASNQYGGRVQELPLNFFDVPIDKGAEWIHGHPKVLQDLLLYENDRTTVLDTLETISYRPQSYGVYTQSQRRRRDWFRFYYREHKFYNTTWYQYLQNYIVPYVTSNIVYNATVDMIETTTSDTTSDNSSSTTNDDNGSSNKVRVTTTDGQEYVADKVVVAVPLSILPDITFIPALPESKQMAIDNVYVAGGMKAWIEFSHRFYPDIQATSTFFGFSDESANADPVYFNAMFRKPSTRNVLAYFSVGTDADIMTQLSDDEIFKTLMEQLDTIFDGQATKYYMKHYIQNWSKEPHIMGAYSDDWDDYDRTITELAKPIHNDQIYFAGEHTERIEVATVHGAAISGRRAAHLLLQ